MSILARLGKHTGRKTATQKRKKNRQSYLSALLVPRDEGWRVASGRTLQLQLLATSHPAQ